MNRSIFHIWKQTNKVNLNWKQKNNFSLITYFKYNETTSFRNTNIIKKVFQIHDTNGYKDIVGKFDNHSNAIFEMFNNKSNDFRFIYLCCNSNRNQGKTSEFISQFLYKGKWTDQYVNYNHPLFVTKDANTILENYLVKRERDNFIHELIIKSDKIKIMEDRLSRGYEFFNTCMKFTKRFDHCYQTLTLDYNDHAQLITQMYYHYPFF